MAGKRKWWLILISAVLAIAVICLLFWDVIILYLAPKTVLSAALTDAFSKMEQRFSDSPVWLLAEGYDENGRNTTLLQLRSSNGVQYDMKVQTDLTANQIFAEGTVTAGGNKLDMSAYLDRDFAALTSNDLLQGGYYGITYDTFVADIRSFPLLTLFLPSETIGQWENSVLKLDSFMNRSYILPKVPEISQEDVYKALLGLMALKSHVSSQPIAFDGVTLEGYRIYYDVTGEQVGQLLSPMLPGANSQSRIIANFYLYENRLVEVRFQGTTGSDSVAFTLSLGLDAATDDLTVAAERVETGAKTSLAATLSTMREDGRYAEVIRVGDTEISYDWNPETGDMNLTLPDKAPICLTLSAAENGVTVVTKDFAALVGIDTQKEFECTMTVKKGAQIETPVYKNLEEWSLEDLLVLLQGVGALLGISVQN